DALPQSGPVGGGVVGSPPPPLDPPLPPPPHAAATPSSSDRATQVARRRSARRELMRSFSLRVIVRPLDPHADGVAATIATVPREKPRVLWDHAERGSSGQSRCGGDRTRR